MYVHKVGRGLKWPSGTFSIRENKKDFPIFFFYVVLTENRFFDLYGQAIPSTHLLLLLQIRTHQSNSEPNTWSWWLHSLSVIIITVVRKLLTDYCEDLLRKCLVSFHQNKKPNKQGIFIPACAASMLL